MRTFVHLMLLVCAAAIAVGAFGPVVGGIEPHNVRAMELRDGFAAGTTMSQIGHHSPAFWGSLAPIVLGVAVVVLLAALTGVRALGWLGVLAGAALLGVLGWRLDDRFDNALRHDYRSLFSGTWGLYLVGGALVIGLLLLLVPRER